LKSADSVLFETFKKRRACRHFEPRPIPDGVLDKLVYAAHRAPTGGNTPYRFVVVVKDPTKLKMLKLVAPGYFGDSSAAIVVCTDLKVAQEGLGTLGVDQCSLYDAGAAAENVVLAAYSLGLGASFIKSYSEIALRRILDLPEGYRTELVVSVGYPSKSEPPPLRQRKGGNISYRDSYGQRWPAMEGDERSPVQSDNEKVTPEQYIFELALFLLTAARGCVTEPHMYGPLRLVDGVSRLTDLYSKTDLLKSDQVLIDAKKKIDEKKYLVMASPDEFVKFMDEMIGQFSEEMKRRYTKEHSA
jgi:nitroreductase